MDLVPLMLVGVSITGSRARFILPRAGVPMPEIALADATHVGSLPLIEGFLFRFIVCLSDFFLFCRCLFLLLRLGILPWSAHRSILWSSRAHRAYCLLLYLIYFFVPVCANACVYECMRYDMECLF